MEVTMSIIREEQVTTTTTFLSQEELLYIRHQAEQEFPNDKALQEVHIARKIIAREAEKLGIEYLKYIKQLAATMQPQS
jgi:hypothetical protein